MGINKINLFVCISIVVYSLSSCIPTIRTGVLAGFKNCTSDTVYIGASHYDDIDSVGEQVTPHYNIVANDCLDTTDISLWEKTYFRSDCFVYPDSLCSIDANFLFYNTDTCYFFLIKYEDAKKHSWHEIRTKKLFRKWIVIRDEEDKFDGNISYNEN